MTHTINDIQAMPMIRLVFSKSGRAAWLSHLDTMGVIARALIRAGLPVWHTEGFNPHPYISFAQPLSVGFEGRRELLELRMTEYIDLSPVPAALSAVLPDGIVVHGAYPAQRPFKQIAWAEYLIAINRRHTPALSDAETARAALSKREILIVKKTKKDRKPKRRPPSADSQQPEAGSYTDIAPMIARVACADTGGGVEINCVLKCAPDGSLNPEYLLDALGLPREAADASCTRMRLLDADMREFA